MKRPNWKQDQPEHELLIKSCISCPDSVGFKILPDGMLKEADPRCGFYPRAMRLHQFPLIPASCPRLWAQMEEDSGFVPCIDQFPGKAMQRFELWQNLSDEAKEVIRIIFGLPIEAISLGGWFLRKTIKLGIENSWKKEQPKKNFSNVYKELHRYVQNF